MKSSRQVERIIGRARLGADRAFDEQVQSDTGAALAKTTDNRPLALQPGLTIWRTIMDSPYTRVAAVLTVGVAVFCVLFPTRHGIIPESVALADVRIALEAQETVYAKGTRVLIVDEMPSLMPPGLAPLFDRPGGQTGPFVLTLSAETYMSSLGYATKIYDKNGGFLVEVCVHNETGTATILLHTAKAYIQFNVSQTYRDKMAQFTIQGFIDMMYRSGDYQKVGPKRVGRVDAIGFEVTDWHERILEGFDSAIVTFFFNMQHATARVWIDPETRLPIQTEAEVRMKACLLTFFKDASVEQMDRDFQWGREIDEAIFLPNIPEDYTPIGPKSIAKGGHADPLP